MKNSFRRVVVLGISIALSCPCVVTAGGKVGEYKAVVDKLQAALRGRSPLSEAWYSSDIEDLEPVKGTSWLVVNKLGTFTIISGLTFESSAVPLEDLGAVGLYCETYLQDIGLVTYSNQTAWGGEGFVLVVWHENDVNQYDFIVKDGIATGYFRTTMSGGGTSDPFIMSGVQYDPSDLSILAGFEGDINGDGKIGMEEAINALQILSSAK